MSFVDPMPLAQPRRGRRQALLKSNSIIEGKYKRSKSTSKADDKNIAALTTIKEIIETLETVHNTHLRPSDKKLIPPYYRPQHYSPPYYEASTNYIKKEFDNQRLEKRRKYKPALKFNGLQDIIPDFECKLKPAIQSFPDSTTTDTTFEGPKKLELRKPHKSRTKKKDKSPPKMLHGNNNFGSVETQTVISSKENDVTDKSEPYPIKPTINPLNFLPPGTKLCPNCCEALKRGEYPPSGFLRPADNCSPATDNKSSLCSKIKSTS